MSELQTTNAPVTMTISAFSGITQKLNYLTQAIENETEAETTKVFIESFKEVRKIKDDWRMTNVIRLSIELGIWTEITTYDKFEGSILPQNVSVNLFDFYNVIDNCKDDIITLWIDDSDNTLIINTFYNEHRDQDELEVRLPIYDIGYQLKPLTIDPEIIGDTPTYTLPLPPIILYTIMNELNVENLTDGIYVSCKDGRIYFTSDYHGYITRLNFTELNANVGFSDWTYFIPFRLMSLLAATGTVTNLKFDFYTGDENKLIVDTEDYKFSYDTTPTAYDTTLPTEGEDFLVAKSDVIQPVASLITRLNKAAPYSIYNIKKVDGFTAEIESSYGNRFSVSVYTDMAMLSDRELNIDSRIFERIFTRNMVDAVKLVLVDDINVLAHIETPVYDKILYYQHEQFVAYRSSNK